MIVKLRTSLGLGVAVLIAFGAGYSTSGVLAISKSTAVPETEAECIQAIRSARTEEGAKLISEYCLVRFPKLLTPTPPPAKVRRIDAPALAIEHLRANPGTWKEFEQEFGYLPDDFVRPGPTDADLEYLRKHPYLVARFIQAFGFDPSDDLLGHDKGENLSMTRYVSNDGLISYDVPPGFKLAELPDPYKAMFPSYKMAYAETLTAVPPSILINTDTVANDSIRDSSFILFQRDLLKARFSSVSVDTTERFNSRTHSDILNALFRIEHEDVHFYNSVYYFYYPKNDRHGVLWTMTCTFSQQEKELFTSICRKAAESFSYHL